MAALAVNKPGAGVDSGRQGSRGTAVVKVLECGVCEDVFSLQGDKVPRLLLCGHTVCHDCLTRLPLHGRAIRCPFDRQVTDLGVYQYLRPGLVEGVNRLLTSILAL